MMHKPILTVTELTGRGHHKAAWGLHCSPRLHCTSPGTGFMPAHAQGAAHLTGSPGPDPSLWQELCRLLDKVGSAEAAHGQSGHKASSPSASAFLLLNRDLVTVLCIHLLSLSNNQGKGRVQELLLCTQMFFKDD